MEFNLKLKILFDCTEIINWHGHYTGIQRVVAGFYNGLLSLDCNVKPFYIKDNKAFELENKQPISITEGDVVITAGSNWDRPDNNVFFESLRNKGAYYINVFYDLTPIYLPHSFGPGLSEAYKAWLDKTIPTCSLGVSISQNTKLDLQNYAVCNDLSQPEYITVRLADNIVHTDSGIKLPRSVVGKNFILCVGSVEFRKNHITLLNAYRVLRQKNLTIPILVIVGHEGWMNLNIKHQIDNDPQLKGNVVMLTSTTDEELHSLYSECMFTLYSSIYEGWGLPVAESCSYGKPCIAASNSSLVEIAPDLVIHAKTLDPYDWAEKIELLAFNSSYREALSEKIKSEYKQTSWKSSAAELISKLSGYLEAKIPK